MRYSILFLVSLLTACADNTVQDTYQAQNPATQIVIKCSELGYANQEFHDCVSSATVAYKEELARQEKENAKEVERRSKEYIEAQKEAKKRQLAAEDEKCTGNGIKKGTSQFAVCMKINHCVTVVHNTHPQEQYMESYYNHFDAFYNLATGAVETNATRNGDSDPWFIFKKCMAEQGVPLGDVHK